MQLVHDRFPGIVLLLRLNADRIVTVGTVIICLLSGAYLASVIVGG